MKDSATEIGTGVSPEVQYWQRQISSSKKRLDSFTKKAKKATAIYEAEKDDGVPFNILYSNTETLLPAVYSDIPRPVVAPRYKDENPVSQAASQALERIISFTVDNPVAGYEGFHPLFDAVALSALVPGFGALQIAYDADISNYNEATNEEEIKKDGGTSDAGDVDGQDSSTAALINQIGKQQSAEGGDTTLSADPSVPPAIPEVKNEAICGRTIPWDHLQWGFAKRWKDVPWLAIMWDMTKADVKKSFGEAISEKLTYSNNEKDDDGKKDGEEKRPDNTCRIWEIWHKSARKVLFYAEGYHEGIIKTVDDPLGLQGFFNIPEPLWAFKKINALVPVPLYAFYQKQAEELNRLTLRITKITEAIKARGLYDKSIGTIGEVFKGDDNELLPADGVQRMSQGGGAMDTAIWMVPIDKLSNVLVQLVQQRQNVKQVIYEITGISDILRGASVASETATAQNIKNQWGTLRIKRLQKNVQDFVRDSFRIIAEIASEHFSEETFAKMTSLPFPSSQEKEQLQAQFEQTKAQFDQAQQQAQMAQQQQPPAAGSPPSAPGQPMPPGPPQAQPPGPPQGGPPGQPPPPDPAQQQLAQMQQQLGQMEQQLKTPSWGEILTLLKDDVLRSFRIDVETNSTLDPEAVEDRTAVGEMLQSLTGMLQQLMPGAQSGIMPMTVVKGLLKSMLKRFRFGSEVEAAVNSMPDQLPNMPNPQQMEKQQKEMQAKGEELTKQEQQLGQEKQSLDMDRQSFDMQKQMFEEKMKMAEEQLKMKEEMMVQRIEMAEQQSTAAIDQKRQQAELAISGKQQKLDMDHQARSHELDAQHSARSVELENKAQQSEFSRKAHWDGVSRDLAFQQKQQATAATAQGKA